MPHKNVSKYTHTCISESHMRTFTHILYIQSKFFRAFFGSLTLSLSLFSFSVFRSQESISDRMLSARRTCSISSRHTIFMQQHNSSRVFRGMRTSQFTPSTGGILRHVACLAPARYTPVGCGG